MNTLTRFLICALVLGAPLASYGATASQVVQSEPQWNYLEVGDDGEPVIALISGSQILRRSIDVRHLKNLELDFNTTVAGSDYVGTAGLRVRNMTTSERDALTASDGQLIYNETVGAFQGVVSSSWTSLSGGGGGSTDLDTAYSNGNEINVSGGNEVLLNDQQTAGDRVLKIDGKAPIASGSHTYVEVLNTQTHTTTGAVTGLHVDFDSTTVGSGTPRGVHVGMPASTDAALYVEDGGLKIDGTGFITVDAGDLTLTSGDLTMSSGNLDVTGTGAFSGAVTTAALTPSGLVTLNNSSTSASELFMTCTGAMSEDCVRWTDSQTGAVPSIDLDISGARNAAGHWLDADITATGSANVIDLRGGASAYQGDYLYVNTGTTATAAQGLVCVGGGATRTVPLVDIDDESDGSGATATFTRKAASSAATLALDWTDAGTGDGINVALANAAAGAQALVIDDGNRAFTSPPVQVTATGAATANSNVIQATVDGANFTAGNGIYAAVVSAAAPVDGFTFETSGAFTGTAFQGDLSNAGTTAQGLEITGGDGNYSVPQVDFEDQGGTPTDAFFDIRRSSSSAQALVDIDDDVAASTGTALLVQSTATAAAANKGRLLHVLNNGALTDTNAGQSLFRVEEQGTWTSGGSNARYMADFVHSGGAGGANGDYAVHVASSGSNVEALYVDSGQSRFDEPVGIGGVASSGQLHIIKGAGDTAIYVDAATTNSTVSAVQVAFDGNTAEDAGIQVDYSNTADVTGVAAFYAKQGTSTALGAGNLTTAFRADVVGNASDNATSERTGILLTDYSANGGSAIPVGVDIQNNYTYAMRMVSGSLTWVNAAGVIESSNPSSGGNGEDLTLRSGDGDASNDNAGDFFIEVGVESGSGDPGVFQIKGSDGAASEETWLTLDPDGGGATLSNSARRTRTEYLRAQDFTPRGTGGAAAAAEFSTTRIIGLAYDGASDEEACSTFKVPDDWSAGTDIDVDLVYTSANAGSDIVWVVNYLCGGDSDSLGGAGTTVTCSTDTIDVAQDKNLLDCGTDLTSANLGAVGNTCRFCVSRDADNAADTDTNDAYLVGVDLNRTSEW